MTNSHNDEQEEEQDIIFVQAKPPVDETNRLVYFSGIFNEGKACDIISRLIALDAIDHTRDIIMYIDSYGGIVDSFLAIHDAIKMLRCDVATVCIGKAMSCGAMLLMSGTKGKRFITPNSRVLLHQIMSMHVGKAAELANEMKETRRQQKLLESMIAKYTNIKKGNLEKILKYDSYFSAEQTLKLGIVDHIIKKPGDLHNKITLTPTQKIVQQEVLQIIDHIDEDKPHDKKSNGKNKNIRP